ncbi:hypothetical protein SRHO_G00021960 [Serrasalmus rhombeus]
MAQSRVAPKRTLSIPRLELCPAIKLLIQKYDQSLHHPGAERVYAEMRRRFWILRSREAIRRYQRACVECQRWRAKVPKMADLPESRLCLFKPVFYSTGTDCFGPLVVKFWSAFIRHYLPSLQARVKWFKSSPGIPVGAVVLVVDPQQPRAQWPIGKVVKVHPSRDDQVRSVDVLIQSKVYTRPVARLIVLPAVAGRQQDTSSNQVSLSSVVNRGSDLGAAVMKAEDLPLVSAWTELAAGPNSRGMRQKASMLRRRRERKREKASAAQVES